MTEQLCESCGNPMPAEWLERHPEGKLCAPCVSRVERVIAAAGTVDDIRWRRERLPEALRRPENLADGD
jgi:hypothetical protein